MQAFRTKPWSVIVNVTTWYRNTCVNMKPFFAGRALYHVVTWKLRHSAFAVDLLLQKPLLRISSFFAFASLGTSALPSSQSTVVGRCCRIFTWLNQTSSGFSPMASAVANAIAYSPQSDVPDCIGTCMNCRRICGLSVTNKAAI